MSDLKYGKNLEGINEFSSSLKIGKNSAGIENLEKSGQNLEEMKSSSNNKLEGIKNLKKSGKNKGLRKIDAYPGVGYSDIYIYRPVIDVKY